MICFIVLRETYAPILLARKAARLRGETGNAKYQSTLDQDGNTQDLLKRSIVRPLRLLLFYPIVTLMCLYIAILYGTIYLFYATFAFVFQDVYSFSTSSSGLVFIACGIGTLVGLGYLALVSDSNLKKQERSRGTMTPEDRLPYTITCPGAVTYSIGIFLYGWGVEHRAHWIVPQIGTALTGFGYILIFTAIQTYLIDAFEAYSASVTAANAVLRGLAGALLPLSGLELYKALGWDWGNYLLALVALAFAPSLWVFAVYGARIRQSKRARIAL